MLYVNHIFQDNFVNADASDKRASYEILMDELAKLMANNQLNVVYVLRNAGIPLPENPTQKELCKIVLDNLSNREVAKQIASLMLINNKVENYLSASGKRYRNSDNSFGVLQSDQNKTASVVDQKQKSELGKQILTTLQDEKVQAQIAQGLATLTTWWQSRKAAKGTTTNAYDELNKKTSNYTYTKKSAFRPVYLIYIVLGLGLLTGGYFLISKLKYRSGGSIAPAPSPTPAPAPVSPPAPAPVPAPAPIVSNV